MFIYPLLYWIKRLARHERRYRQPACKGRGVAVSGPTHILPWSRVSMCSSGPLLTVILPRSAFTAM